MIKSPISFFSIVHLCTVLLISVYHVVPYNNSPVVEAECQPLPKEALELSLEAGQLIYVDEIENIKTLMGEIISEEPQISIWDISPNGSFIGGSSVESINPYIDVVIVLDQSGQKIYSGAPSQAIIFDERWLGNERLISLVTFSIPRGLAFGYFVIDPFRREYSFIQPNFELPFYNNNWFFVGGYNFTYDGRYLFNRGRGVFDFETQQPLELNNFRWGVPSSTSHNLLVLEYTSLNYGEPVDEKTHPVSIYNFEHDLLTEITNITTDAPVDLHDNSWSPDETRWAYSLYYRDQIAFRPIGLLELDSGNSQLTCLGLFYQIDISAFNQTQFAKSILPPDFAWSRDSRYLALQGVLEGQDMVESLGVYIYDTQTDEIYEVYKGRADIVGWMANP